MLTVLERWLKYSSVYELTGDAPWLSLGCHDNETLVSVTRMTDGRLGAAGNVDASGIRWKTTDALEGCRTWSCDDQEDSPVSLTARHVYTALSLSRSSVNHHTRACAPAPSTPKHIHYTCSVPWIKKKLKGERKQNWRHKKITAIIISRNMSAQCVVLCGRPPMELHKPNHNPDLWSFELKSSTLVIPAMGNVCGNFSLSTTFSFRLKSSYGTDRRTNRRTYGARNAAYRGPHTARCHQWINYSVNQWHQLAADRDCDLLLAATSSSAQPNCHVLWCPVICRCRTQSLALLCPPNQESASGRHSCDWLSQLL